MQFFNIFFVLLLSQLTCVLSRISKIFRLHDFEDRVFSQNGEDGVLLALLDEIGVYNRYFVEFGVGNGVECNSRILWERLNFTGLLMDYYGPDNRTLNLHVEHVTESNVVGLFQTYGVPLRFDVLSVDIDMFDWW